jgi:signal peptidase I
MTTIETGTAATVRRFLGQPSAGAMSPMLEPGDRIIVDRLARGADEPAPGHQDVPSLGRLGRPTLHGLADRAVGEP